jgi:hypothetical protein
MARIPTLTKIATEEFPAEVRPWIGKLLGPLNSFLTATVYALTRHLTFADNLMGQEVLLDFTYQGTQTLPSFLVDLGGATPLCFQVAQATENLTPVCLALAWQLSNGSVQIKDASKISSGSVTTLVTGARYQIRVRITP